MDVQDFKSELELFESLQIGDTWADARLSEVYLYLWKNKELVVPVKWQDTMRRFTAELRAAAWLCAVRMDVAAEVNEMDPFGLNVES